MPSPHPDPQVSAPISVRFKFLVSGTTFIFPVKITSLTQQFDLATKVAWRQGTKHLGSLEGLGVVLTCTEWTLSVGINSE